VSPTPSHALPAPAPDRRQTRRAALGSFAGTTLEWYDFFIYGTAAALVFGDVFFPGDDPTVGTLAAFATFAVGFAARPIGSVLFGHFGDRIGRRNVLMVTLLLMGGATVLIGCIPSYDSIGIWAPVLLVVCRIAQGIALGGEWGGAALLSVENAPEGRKGLFGSSTQMGSPAGLLLASVVVAGASNLSGDAFETWGWRLPFWGSAVIVVVGWAIRRGLAESHDFEQVQEAEERGAADEAHAAVPIGEVLRHQWREVLLGAGLGAANNAIYYTVATYTLAYVTDELGIDDGEVLNHLTIVSVFYLASIPLFGWLSDRVGMRRQVAVAGVAAALFVGPYFLLLETGHTWLILAAMVVGLAGIQSAAYAPQPAIYADLFPARTRYTGASLSYALPTTVVGGTTPLIATWLYAETGSNLAMAVFVVALSLLAAACAATAHVRHQRQQGFARAEDQATPGTSQTVDS
jgi:MHS family shikimate/dehydroshikimate transporter-like MFS transporter